MHPSGISGSLEAPPPFGIGRCPAARPYPLRHGPRYRSHRRRRRRRRNFAYRCRNRACRCRNRNRNRRSRRNCACGVWKRSRASGRERVWAATEDGGWRGGRGGGARRAIGRAERGIASDERTRKFIYLSVNLSICLSICQSVNQSIN